MIESINETGIILSSNDRPVSFVNDDLRTRSASCCGFLQHSEGAPIYKIIEPGIYEISFNGNITSLTPGVVALGLLEDGIVVNGTTMIATIDTAGDYKNISFNKKIRVCCKANASLAIASIPTVPVYSTATPVNTDTEVPIITNANFSITRICG